MMTNAPRKEFSQPPARGRWRNPILKPIATIELWLCLSLVFVLLIHLSESVDGASWFWPFDPALSLVFLVALQVPRYLPRRQGLKLTSWHAALIFLGVSWCVSMLYELTLSQALGKLGGMHPKTVGSFVIAQGFYVPLAVLGLWLVRTCHLTFYELFFVAGMTSIYEATTIGIPYLLSGGFFLSPIVIAYYFVVYSRFLSTGLLVVDAELLWDASQRRVSFAWKLAYGTLLGIVCWIIFIAWGELVIYLFNDFAAYS